MQRRRCAPFGNSPFSRSSGIWPAVLQRHCSTENRVDRRDTIAPGREGVRGFLQTEAERADHAGGDNRDPRVVSFGV